MAACGAFHVAAVTEDGELFTWGRGMDAQLATGGLANELLPRRIGLLGGFRVVAAAAGHSHTAAVTEDGALWTWGCGRATGLMDNFSEWEVPKQGSLLGHGDKEERWVPTVVSVQKCITLALQTTWNRGGLGASWM